ncbi:recombination regulator RecX [Clostridium sp. BJN0001]|uniref:recombination regulator RecX n=1 Tax=Clostridium sp. BJN0001 TaxID=2930219 RepID=UPI001FD51BA8|nr:recombination regulator RecX [Clostridium sp. BJN0001]
MKKITKIEHQKRNKDRFNIYVNDVYSFAVSIDILYSESLKEGIEIDEEKIKSISDKEMLNKCKNTALNIIERNLKTKKQLENKLREKEFDDSIIFETMKFLEHYGYINDSEYIKLFIKEKIKKYGKRKIIYELIRKGIKKEDVELEFENSSYIEDIEIESAKKIAKKKLDSILKKEDDKYKIRGKLYNYLLSKGYQTNIIKQIIEELT